MRRLCAFALLLLCVLLAPSGYAQTFPPLTGRLVDNARLLNADQARQLNNRLAAIEQQTGHQLVVATLPGLQGYDIADYGYRLGRAWKIGNDGKDGAAKDDGVLLIVAPKERKVRIEVGYGLEGQLTDAMSGQIIGAEIVPRFKANDYPGGIVAGTEAIARQIALTPEQARAQAAAAAKAATRRNRDGNIHSAIFVGMFLMFFVAPMLFGRGGRGRAYRGGIAPVVLWGAGSGSGGGGSSWGGGGGGFSGGGGSFGGGGASGGW